MECDIARGLQSGYTWRRDGEYDLGKTERVTRAAVRGCWFFMANLWACVSSGGLVRRSTSCEAHNTLSGSIAGNRC